MKQLPLFALNNEDSAENHEWGTFKDSLRAPVHNWFTYPAGFSYKAVEANIKAHNISTNAVVYDPFMGTGTTNLSAKSLGISSYGTEAHPFVYRIARTKLNWNIDSNYIAGAIKQIETEVSRQRKHVDEEQWKSLEDEFPELVLKCYTPKTLWELFLIREAILNNGFPPETGDFLFVGLTSLLRQVSVVETGWPYIAPKKQKSSSLKKDVLIEFSRQLHQMVRDVEAIRSAAHPNYPNTFHRIFNGDARNVRDEIPDQCIDHVFTSPPYLNNFDYADRTRLELYFFGEAKTWGDITEFIRARLITSATTQINRNDPRYMLSGDLQKACPEVYDYLSNAVGKLGKLRLTKGGKKSYDYLVSGYFNDMFLIISEIYRVLKPESKAVFILGDSAPYGVHIPTDEFIGKIGIGVGFSTYQVDVLRTRGGKWKDNPQRHDVSLREAIVTLAKS